MWPISNNQNNLKTENVLREISHLLTLFFATIRFISTFFIQWAGVRCTTIHNDLCDLMVYNMMPHKCYMNIRVTIYINTYRIGWPMVRIIISTPFTCSVQTHRDWEKTPMRSSDAHVFTYQLNPTWFQPSILSLPFVSFVNSFWNPQIVSKRWRKHGLRLYLLSISFFCQHRRNIYNVI